MHSRKSVFLLFTLSLNTAYVFGAASGSPSASSPNGIFELREEYKTPGLETELSGIYPHLTRNDLYYVVTNGKPEYKTTMKPMLPPEQLNKLLLVNRDGKVIKVISVPYGGGLFGDLAYGDGHMWLSPLDPPMLWKMNLESGNIVARYPLPGPAGGMEFDRERSVIYVQNYIGHPHLAVIDPKTGMVIKSLWSDENCQGVKVVDGDLLTIWTSSWEPNAYSELWQLDPETGKPKLRVRLDGVHAAMAPLDPKVAGYEGFMTLMHKGSAVSGETVIRRYKYVSERRRSQAATAQFRDKDLFAAVSFSPTLNERNENVKRLSQAIEQAARNGAAYITVPELALVGSLSRESRNHLSEFADTVPGPTSDTFANLAKRLNIWLAMSLTELNEQKTGYYISTILFNPTGDIVSKVRKRVLRFDGRDGDATVGFARILMDSVDAGGRRVGILSGDDLLSGIPRLADRGADTIMVSANWSLHDPVHWPSVVRQLAETYQVNLVVASQESSLSGIFLRTGRVIADGSSSDTTIQGRLPGPSKSIFVESSFGLPSVPIPAYLPFSPGLIELGRKLFFDPKLSVNGVVSCATCHPPNSFFADGKIRSQGVQGRSTGRNTPTLLNVAFKSTLHWDGNPTTLEQQVKYPLGNFAEMNLRSADDLSLYIRSRHDYVTTFGSEMHVKPEEIGREEIAHALATYERTLISGSSAFDHFYYGGEPDALSASAKRGLQLFVGKAQCAVCHQIGDSYALFLDSRFHSLGVGYQPETKTFLDQGVGIVSSSDYAGKFFTPSLRNVAQTAPYMHDGSARTLEEAIKMHFKEPIIDPSIPHLRLTGTEITELVGFLQSLTGSDSYSAQGIRLSRNHESAAKISQLKPGLP